jgi:DNA-binding MarR family transcriptional regulator
VELRHPQLVDEAIEAYRTYWTALLQAAEPMWAQLELTISQLKCLVLIETRETLTIGQVAEVLGMSRSSASITIDQLVQLGLVGRTEDQEDRRRTIVCLTTEGRTRISRLRQGDEQYMRDWFERMDKDHLAALRIGLAALAQVMVSPLA